MDTDATLVNPFAATTDPPMVYEHYRRLRHVHGPLHWSEQLHAWVALGYRQASQVLSQPGFDKRAFLERMQHNFGPSVADLLPQMPFFMEPPGHTRTRKLLAGAFTNHAVGQLRPQIQAFTDALLQRAAPGRHLDVVADLAEPLPVLVIGAILGVPEPDQALFADPPVDVSQLLTDLKAYLETSPAPGGGEHHH